MAARNATKDAILTYIRASSEPVTLYAIKKYMWVMFRSTGGATCTALWRLRQAGLVERVGSGWYRICDERQRTVGQRESP